MLTGLRRYKEEPRQKAIIFVYPIDDNLIKTRNPECSKQNSTENFSARKMLYTLIRNHTSKAPNIEYRNQNLKVYNLQRKGIQTII